MKKAICTGINDYPGTANDLSGCVNDANDWANILVNLGFDVTILTNSQVTKNTFKTSIQNTITNLVSGDVLVITYSGHGTQVYDNSGDETDGYDEALYLYDGVFTDDEMRSILDTIKDGVHVFFISDSCFSGTISRKISASDAVLGKPRFIVTDIMPVDTKLTKKFLVEGDMKEIVLTGCSDTEYSYDAYINGRWNGAMTAFATSCVTPNQTYNEFFTKLRAKLPSSSYPQTPQLEGKDINKTMTMFESFSSESGEPIIDPIDPPTTNVGCLGKFLPKLFTSKKKLEILTEAQLLVITGELGIEAKVEDLKSETVDKIWNFLINQQTA